MKQLKVHIFSNGNYTPWEGNITLPQNQPDRFKVVNSIEECDAVLFAVNCDFTLGKAVWLGKKIFDGTFNPSTKLKQYGTAINQSIEMLQKSDFHLISNLYVKMRIGSKWTEDNHIIINNNYFHREQVIKLRDHLNKIL